MFVRSAGRVPGWGMVGRRAVWIVALAGSISLVATGSDARTDQRPQVWCAPESFPYAALRNPTGAERSSGEPAEALRDHLASPEARLLPDRNWRVLERGRSYVLFGHGRAPEFRSVRVIREADGSWRYQRTGGCRELLRFRHGVIASHWRLRPGTRLQAGKRTIRILVKERYCASGRSAKGRIERPLIVYGSRSIRIATFVRPLPGGGNCQENPETRFLIRLREPLGERRLLNATTVPAVPVGSPSADKI